MSPISRSTTMEPSDAYQSGDEKRMGLKMQLSEHELFNGDDIFFSPWNHEIRAVKSPDPSTAVEEQIVMFAEDNRNGPPTLRGADTAKQEGLPVGNSSAFHEVPEEQYGSYVNRAPIHTGFMGNWSPQGQDEPCRLNSTYENREPTDRSVASNADSKMNNPKQEDRGGLPPRRMKKPKPKCGPQRPLSAYNLFFKHYRLSLIKEMGGPVPFVVMGKEVGRKWKSLPPRERDKWEKQAEAESNRYREELKAYKERNKKKRKLALTGNDSSSSGYVAESNTDNICSEPIQGMSNIDGGVTTQEIGTHQAIPRIKSLDGDFWQQETSVNTWGDSACNSAGVNRDSSNMGSFLTSGDQQVRQSPHVAMSPKTDDSNNISHQGVLHPAAETSSQTPFSRAKEVVNLPGDYALPEGLPPSGTEIFLPDSTGALRPHKLNWKVFSLAPCDAQSFIDQIQQNGQCD